MACPPSIDPGNARGPGVLLEGDAVMETFSDTRRQLEAIRRYGQAIANLPLMLVLGVSGVFTSIAWQSGQLMSLLEVLPGWAQMLIVMPLLGSMITIYALGGLTTVSLFLSVSMDIALAPIRNIKRRATDA